jgi:hypothetical protein
VKEGADARAIALVRPKPALYVRLKVRERSVHPRSGRGGAGGVAKSVTINKVAPCGCPFVEASPSVANFAIPAPGAFFGRLAAASPGLSRGEEHLCRPV